MKIKELAWGGSWGVLYILSGLLAVWVNPPDHALAIVWFPTGVATAAFLLSRYRVWPWYLAGFTFANLLFEGGALFSLSDALEVMLFAFISLPVSMAIAWGVKCFARKDDEFHAVFMWLFITLCASAAEALLFAVALSHIEHASFVAVFWSGFVSDAAGVIFSVVVIMGLINGHYKSAEVAFWRWIIGAGLLLGVGLTSWFIFNDDVSHVFNSVMDNAMLHFVLACLPVLLCTLTLIAAGNRAGALSLLVMAGLAMVFTRGGQGPFFIDGLNSAEPFILLQVYLTGAAMLLVFIRVIMVGSLFRPASDSSCFGLVYQLDLRMGNIRWSFPKTPLPFSLQSPMSEAEVMRLVHPDDRSALRLYWHGGALAPDALRFKVQSRAGEWVLVEDVKKIVLTPKTAPQVLGEWHILEERGVEAVI